MTDHLKKVERERRLERVRGKARKAPKKKAAPPPPPGPPEGSDVGYRERQFEDGPQAYDYARTFGGTVRRELPPGRPAHYVVTIPVPLRKP